jgi:transposase
MDPREQRAIVIAAMCRIVHRNGVWLVPSQSVGEKQYEVNLATDKCTCPDCENGFLCKHVRAVKIVVRRERGMDGDITETKEVTFTEKKTYSQNWPKYNLAQMTEKTRFLQLLFDLTRGVTDFPQPKTGRRHAPLSDMIFASAFKVYSTFSLRRFACDLKDAFDKGFLSELMHSVRIGWYLENPVLTPVLHQLVVQSSLPLRSVETVFAPDSTGFSTSRFVKWYDEKYGVERSGHTWVKAHAMCGVKTNVITSVEIGDKDAADSPFFKPLLETTAKGFNVKEVTADKAYLSHDNLAAVEKLGGTAYIPFKSNSVQGEAGSIWEKMFLYYNFRREEFLQHYHQRSNVESTFSMVKAKFRDHVRSKTDVAMKNEVLLKLLCHNVVVVHQAIIELGIEGTFWPEWVGEREDVLPMLQWS